MDCTTIFILSLLVCLTAQSLLLFLTQLRLRSVEKGQDIIMDDIYDFRKALFSELERYHEENFHSFGDVENKLDQILQRMQDINLRVTVVETRIEERTPEIEQKIEAPRYRRLTQTTRRGAPK